jgi:hypothetical protein
MRNLVRYQGWEIPDKMSEEDSLLELIWLKGGFAEKDLRGVDRSLVKGVFSEKARGLKTEKGYHIF